MYLCTRTLRQNILKRKQFIESVGGFTHEMKCRQSNKYISFRLEVTQNSHQVSTIQTFNMKSAFIITFQLFKRFHFHTRDVYTDLSTTKTITAAATVATQLNSSTIYSVMQRVNKQLTLAYKMFPLVLQINSNHQCHCLRAIQKKHVKFYIRKLMCCKTMLFVSRINSYMKR